MTTQEILSLEARNVGEVYLHKEGSFWRAYERSAYLFCTQVRNFKVTKKYVKVVKQDVVSIGFPTQGWKQLEGRVVVRSRDPKLIVLNAPIKEVTLDEFFYKFDEWKRRIDNPVPRGQKKADHEGLPVFKDTYDLTIKIFASIQHLNRDHRFTIGEKIKEHILDALLSIYEANLEKDDKKKEIHIKNARRSIERLRLMMRVLYDMGNMGIKNSIQINTEIEEISSQLIAWLTATIKRQQDPQ